MSEKNFAIGDIVKCVYGDIDRNQNAGRVGRITGFARFSNYHPREASVAFDDGRCGWFWIKALDFVQAATDEFDPPSEASPVGYIGPDGWHDYDL